MSRRAADWNPDDTGKLFVSVDRPSHEWRRAVVEQLEPLAKTLGEVRDLAMRHEYDLTGKANAEKMNVALAQAMSDIALLRNNVAWLRWITLSVLVTGILAKLYWK